MKPENGNEKTNKKNFVHVNYLQEKFISFIPDRFSMQYIFEVGSRNGYDTVNLSNYYANATIYSFECNPNSIQKCLESIKTSGNSNIKFYDFGLGEDEDYKEFYVYIKSNGVSINDGASSFFKRIDFNETQVPTSKKIKIHTIKNFITENSIPYIDILCMDVQGFELNILKGCKEFISKINYIIMEEPKPIPNSELLPANVHSEYVNAPTSAEISNFLLSNNFIEIARIQENRLEDNVMYVNKLFGK